MLLVAGPVWAADQPLPPAITPPRSSQPGSPIDTEVVVRVVAHGAMVLGDNVGGARVTITDLETGQLLAAGLQQGEAGDQNQIMRTPRLMEEPRYTSRPSGSFRATLALDHPTMVEITAQGPLSYPAAMRKASTTVLLIPGRDMTNDGIVIPLYGYIVQIENPPPGQPLMAKDDVKFAASVRTLSGSPIRPHGDWDAQKLDIHGEVLIGDRVVEQLQMFYSSSSNLFETAFFVPPPTEAPNGITLRVVAADKAGVNFGLIQAQYPVVPEHVKPKTR